MRRTLIDKAVPNIVGERAIGRRLADNLAFLLRALLAVLEKIIVVSRTHQPGASKRKCHTACIDSDPTTSPLFGNIGRCSRSAGRIENEIARIGSHQKAAIDYCVTCLNHVNFSIGCRRYRAKYS